MNICFIGRWTEPVVIQFRLDGYALVHSQNDCYSIELWPETTSAASPSVLPPESTRFGRGKDSLIALNTLLFNGNVSFPQLLKKTYSLIALVRNVDITA